MPLPETLEGLRERIADEAPYVGSRPYSHNIIALLLRQIANAHGQPVANQAIEDYDLEELGWSKVTT